MIRKEEKTILLVPEEGEEKNVAQFKDLKDKVT